MFAHDTRPFQYASFSLYGRRFILNAEEEREVIEVIKRRRALVKSNTGEYKLACVKAFGMNDENELMGGDE